MDRRLGQAAAAMMLVVLVGACTSGSTPGPAGSGAGTGASSDSGAAASPAAAASQAEPTGGSAPPASVAVPAGPARMYECKALITDAELQQATGVADLAYLSGPSEGSPDGLTDCGYFGRSGALYVQVTVWTGPIKAGFDQLVAAGAGNPATKKLTGIGDRAGYAATADGATGAAAVGDIGVTVAFQAMSDGGAAGIDYSTAIPTILRTVVGRL